MDGPMSDKPLNVSKRYITCRYIQLEKRVAHLQWLAEGSLVILQQNNAALAREPPQERIRLLGALSSLMKEFDTVPFAKRATEFEEVRATN